MGLFGMTKLNRDNPYTDIDVRQTAINELANKPRVDIDNRRYGNTLSDDMFALKNPQIRPNQHTPQSYAYLNDNQVSPSYAMAPAAGWDSIMGNTYPSVNHSAVSGDFRANAPIRKKNIGEGDSLPWEVYKDWGLMDDILEFPDNYTQEQAEWALNKRDEEINRNKVNDLGTNGIREDMRYQRTGAEREPVEQSPRYDAEWDSYLNALVNYQALSPATIQQLANMGVNHPEIVDNRPLDEDSANSYLNYLIKAYREQKGL